MPGKKDVNKPKGAMTSYAAFVQVCRDEHKKKHADEKINFSEFSKKCSERWKRMSDKEKKRFGDIASKDRARYDREMANYVPPPDSKKSSKRKTKDPNAPKRALSAFFFFCNEFRASIKEEHPEWGVGDIAKELGKRWEKAPRDKYNKQAAADKIRYAKEMESYTGGAGGKKAKGARAVSSAESDEDSD